MGELTCFDAIVSDSRPDEELTALAKAQSIDLLW